MKLTPKELKTRYIIGKLMLEKAFQKEKIGHIQQLLAYLSQIKQEQQQIITSRRKKLVISCSIVLTGLSLLYVIEMQQAPEEKFRYQSLDNRFNTLQKVHPNVSWTKKTLSESSIRFLDREQKIVSKTGLDSVNLDKVYYFEAYDEKAGETRRIRLNIMK